MSTTPPLRRQLQRRLFPLYKRLERHVHPLRYLFIEITQRCNLSCLHCGSDCGPSAAEAELTTEEWLSFFGALAARMDPSKFLLVLTGGEPFVRPGFDRIMEGRDIRTPVADAATDDLRARYPDMPSHLARGLGATYAAVVEIRDTEVINQVRRENELRDRLGSGTRDDILATRDETAPQSDRTDRLADEIARVLDHERAGELSAPFETEAERDAFRDEIAQVLDVRQLDRLTSGDADVLEKVLEDRLDRLYVAKVYLQSDAATANTEALRQVVDDLADTEYEKHRATDVDGETERGQVH